MEDVRAFLVVAQGALRQDLRPLFRGAIRASLEVEELEAVVGAEWYARVGGRRERRNGTYVRGLLTSFGGDRRHRAAQPHARGGARGAGALPTPERGIGCAADGGIRAPVSHRMAGQPTEDEAVYTRLMLQVCALLLSSIDAWPPSEIRH